MFLRRLLVFALPALCLMSASGAALAHAHLKASDPEKNAKIKAAPSHISLTFSEPIELNFSAVTITAPDKAEIKTGALSHGKESDNHVVDAPVTIPDTAGTYSVNWRVLSKDGHKMKGSYQFSIAP
ncbi:MAG: copper homeostasis periplasmic binding protein CopC [Hyphomicrobium sp.]